jgi:hypothetical protein
MVLPPLIPTDEIYSKIYRLKPPRPGTADRNGLPNEGQIDF